VGEASGELEIRPDLRVRVSVLSALVPYQATALPACTPPPLIAMATSCRLVRCWLYSKGIEAQRDTNQNRATKPFSNAAY
jgi:hypothetical protein